MRSSGWCFNSPDNLVAASTAAPYAALNWKIHEELAGADQAVEIV